MTLAAHDALPRRLDAIVRRPVAWWLGELRGCRDDLRRWLAVRGRGAVTVEAGERYWVLRRGASVLGQVDAQTGDVAALLRAVPPSARRRLVIEIPPERALAKIVGFPAAAKRQLDRILGFEIARHFPFPADRVYFRHRLVAKGAEDAATIAVEIVAVPREIVDGVCRVLGDAGVAPAAVAVAVGAEAKPLFLAPAALGPARRRAAAHTRIAALAAGLAALAAALSWPLAQRAELAALDRDIAALKPRAEAALRSGEATRRDGERAAAILALGGGRPPLVAALDALSRDLPDGAWLLSLSISGRDVVLDGLAPSAATIALALDKSRGIGGIVFRSPITRETSGLEHFQLGATLGEAKP
ncbi:MAG TPA: PilN domain-containing protein [Stellaceae bacterium]|nr:PilN domain-containing protein [Stellaceae bacterium]